MKTILEARDLCESIVTVIIKLGDVMNFDNWPHIRDGIPQNDFNYID